MGLSQDRIVWLRRRLCHALAHRARGRRLWLDHQPDVHRHRRHLTDDPWPHRHQQRHLHRLCHHWQCLGLDSRHFHRGFAAISARALCQPLDQTTPRQPSRQGCLQRTAPRCRWSHRQCRPVAHEQRELRLRNHPSHHLHHHLHHFVLHRLLHPRSSHSGHPPGRSHRLPRLLALKVDLIEIISSKKKRTSGTRP